MSETSIHESQAAPHQAASADAPQPGAGRGEDFAAAGTSAPAVGETRALAVEWGGAPQATIFGFGDKVPAHHAAWVNGTMSHARDYDDTHDGATLHAGVSVV